MSLRVLLAVGLLSGVVRAADPPDPLSRADGYAGCWYSVGPTKDEYAFKYSGGMATYPQQHAPIAVYSADAKKTFFVYGGKHPKNNSIAHMVSYFDHATGTVPKPAILLDKKTTDAHDNPTLAINRDGHLWVFSNAHGTGRSSYIHRSRKPHSIDSFELIQTTNFSYGCPWPMPDGGFLFCHTLYKDGQRRLHTATSKDGRTWAEPKLFAHLEMGDYQISWRHKGTVGTAFDYHPKPLGLDGRTNLYYLASADGGETWKTAGGEAVKLPLTDVQNAALVKDYAAEKKLVYLKDLNYDADGRPVILYLTSKSHKPGPDGGPHEWHTARWTGKEWEFRPFTTSDHNYDHGSLYVEADRWRVIAPTEPGPQPFGTGGEMVMWTSHDQGKKWTKAKQLTAKSARNHTYARRPVDAHPDFYALWADGNAREPSESALYFTDRDGGKVWRLPAKMTADTEKPAPVE